MLKDQHPPKFIDKLLTSIIKDTIDLRQKLLGLTPLPQQPKHHIDHNSFFGTHVLDDFLGDPWSNYFVQNF